MELIVVIVLGVFAMGVIAFFMALSHGGKIGALSKRIEHLESEVARLSQTPRREHMPRRRTNASVKTAANKPDSELRETTARDMPVGIPLTQPVTSVIEKPPIPAVSLQQEPPQPITAAPEKETTKTAESPTTIDSAETSAPLVRDSAVSTPPKPSMEEEKKKTEEQQSSATGEKTDWEERIGKRWLTWGGVLLLVAATGFLIKYAYDQGWIGPWTQIAIGIAVGFSLCVLGDWQIRVRHMRPLGQGVMALGLTLVYLTCFGAYAYFKLEEVSQLTTLGLLAVTSAAGILLSNRHRSMPICILAAIGGYLAPILVSTGQPPPVNGLFTYTVLVNLGVIVVSMLRAWPALPLLAFGGTIVHFGGWYAKFYQPGQSAGVGMWAAIFHFVFLILPSLPLLRGHRQTPWQWLLPVANAVLGVYVTWTHLRVEHPLALMLILAGMAAAHITIGVKTRGMVNESTIVRSLYSILGLAILTLAPLAWFGMQANLACWLLFGLMLTELGCRFGFRPYRGFGYVNLLLGAAWCVIKLWTDINGDPNLAQFVTLGLGEVDKQYIARSGSIEQFLVSLFSLHFFWTRLLVPMAWGGCALILHRWRVIDSKHFYWQKIIAGVGAVLLTLIFISNDATPWICLTSAVDDPRFALGYSLAPLWCLGMAAVALGGIRWRSTDVSWLSLAFLIPAAVLVSPLYFHATLPEGGYFFNAAYAAKMFFALCCMAAAWSIGNARKTLWIGIAGYLVILTQHSELYSWGGKNQYWLWSLTWNAGALVYLAIGWKGKNRNLAACFWPPLATAAVFAGMAMLDNIQTSIPFSSFANARYLAALLIAVSLFVQALVADRNRLWIAIAAGWIVLSVNHTELYGWFRQQADFGQPSGTYRLYWAAALLHNAGALVYAALFWRFRQKALRIGALPAAALAAAYLVGGFYMRRQLDVLPMPFVNMFFANELLLALAVFITALGSRELRVWLGMLGGYLLLVATHLEIGYWQGPWLEFAGRLSRTAWYTALWSVGALVYLSAAIRYRRKRIYFAALRVLSVALFCAGWQYTQHHREAYTLFLNARFLTSFLALATLFVICRISKFYERGKQESGFINLPGMYRRYMYILAALAGFMLLSFECYSWCFQAWGGGQTGRRVANMSLSIAWGVYSIFLLITGFASRIRGWRLSGLILFGITCLKLVAVDLARLEQLHRILSFMAVGLLLMAASYLYHKLEKRLKEKEPEDGDKPAAMHSTPAGQNENR